MAYIATLNITSATSTGLIIANSASFADASAATVSTLADAVLKSSYVRNGGKLVNVDKNGYLENIHVSNGGYIQNRGANTSAKDIYVSQGGLVYIQSGTKYTNLEIFSGGTALQFSGTVNGMTIHSGGTGMFSTWGQAQIIYNGLTVEAGATFTTYNNFVMSGTISIAAGAWTNDADAGTVDGVLTNLNLNTNATFSNGVKLSNFQTGAGTMIVRGGTATTWAKDVDVTAGTLYIQNGAVGSDIRVSNGAGLQVTNMAAGATLKDITVYAGGTLANSVKAVYEDITIQDGGHWTLGASYDISGDIDFVAGGLTNDADAHAVDGTIYDLDFGLTGAFGQGITLSNFNQTAGAVTLKDGASIKTGTMAAGAYLLYLGGNGSISDFTLKGSAGAAAGTLGTLHVSNGGVLSNVTVETGAQLNVSTGAYCYGLTLDGGIAAVRTETGYASGVTVNDGGTFYIQSNGSAENVHVYTGGSMQFHTGKVNGLVAEAGAVVNRGWVGADQYRTWENIDVRAGAAMTLDNYFVLKGDIDIAQGALTNDADAYAVDGTIYNLDYAYTSGAFMSGVTLSNFNQTGGKVEITSGAAAKDATFGGSALLRKGVTASNVTVTDNMTEIDPQGATTGTDNVYVENLRMTGGAVVVKWAGTVVSNAQVSGGTLYGRSQAIIRDVDIYDGGQLLIANQGDAIISGATVHAGGKLTQNLYTRFTDITVEAGGELTLSNNFDITGDVDIAVGGLANDADAYAVDGVIYDLNLGLTGNFHSGITLSNFTQTAGTINIAADAAVDTVAFTGGTLNISAGATARNITQSAGTLNIAAGADIDGLAFKGGNFAISSGATIKNYDQYVASNVNVVNDAVVDGGTMYAGQLQALNNNSVSRGTIRNYAVSGGVLIVRGAGNLAENITLYNGGVAAIQSGATGRNIEVFSGGNVQAPSHAKGAQVAGLIMHDGATGTFVANDALPVNIGNLVMEQGAQLSITSAKISGAAITGGELTIAGNSNYISSGATINNLTVTGTGQLWINDPYNATEGGAAYDPIRTSNLTVGAGLFVMMHGTNVTASNATVLGSMYVQNGATASGGEIRAGGYLNSWKRGGYNDNGSRGRIVGVTVRSGGSADGTDADFVNMTVEAGGKLSLNPGAAIGGTENNIAQGALYISGVLDADAHTDENHVLRNLGISAQTLNVNSGIALANLSISDAGKVYADDATISGAHVNGVDSKTNALYLTNGAKLNEAYVSEGGVFLSANAEITNAELTGGAVILRGSETYGSGATVLGGAYHVQNGARADDIFVNGGKLIAADTEHVNPAGKVEVVNGVTMLAGQVEVSSGATINGLTATGGRVYVFSSGTINVQTGGALNDLQTVAGAKINFVENKAVATFTGENTNIAEGTLYFNNNAVAGHAANGVLEGFNADNSTVGYKLSIGSGIVLKDAVGNNTAVRVSAFDGAVVSGMTLRGGAIICVNGANVRVLDTTLTGEAGAGQTCNLNLSAGAYASNTVVSANAKIQFQHADAKADNTTIMAGGSMVMTAAADTGDLLTLDFTGTGGDQSVYIDSMARISGDTKIVLSGWTAGNTYTLTTGAATDKTVQCYDWGLYQDAVQGGTTYTNAFDGISYDFTNGKAIVVSTFTAATQEAAGSIESGTTINGNGKAAKWTSATTATGTIKAATSAIAGDAWLELDGANLAGTTLYGAEAGFAKGVNLYATGDAVVGNLAAGAEAGGTVESVKLTVDDATVGLAYAGGFGNVTSATETLIGAGAKMTKDFYAGALANYAKTNTVTSAGDVALTIEAGEFNGNIYGAASVKAGAATSVVHSVGNVTIDVKDGSTTKGGQACLFAGGYATGSTTNKVYTVTRVSTTIEGGSWGTAAGGRGVFGGIFASNVTAEAGNVSVTVSGGSMGNVYGGGWAQKGGSSVVGDVNISIAGGTVANVFGGGSHSSSGGTTEAGDVTITVSGGQITNAIYARGQLEGDTTGTANVIFTGATGFDCGVYGYSYVGGAGEGAALSFTAYTGTFSGAVGGFDRITLDGATAMTIGTAYNNVNNSAWTFNAASRDAALAGTAFLNWNDADFTGDTITLNLNNGDAVAWNLVSADTGTVYNKFDVRINDTSILPENIDIDDVIAGTGTVYDGWGFTDENGTLKFKQLA